MGVIGEAIERGLNHVEQKKLRRIYQRHDLRAEQQQAWRLLGDRFSLLLASENRKNVIVGRFANTA